MKPILYKILILFTLLFATQIFAKDNELSDSEKKCKEFITKAQAAVKRGDYPKALEHLAVSEAIAKENQWSKRIFFIQAETAKVYQYLSNYGEALGYYMAALETAENEPTIEIDIPAILNNIGITYSYQKDYKSALEYYKKAYPLSKRNKSNDLTVLIASNLADLHNNQGNYRQSYKYLLEVKDLPTSDETRQLWQINYAEALALEGRFNEAEKIALNLIDKVEKKRVEGCYVCITELLATIYTRSNDTETAIYYAKKGLYHSDEVKNRIDFYNQLSNLYFKTGEYNLSKQYKDSVIIAKDSLSNLVNQGLFQSNKVKLKIQEYKNDNEKYISERKLLILGIIFCLLLCSFIYWWLRSRIVKQKHEKIIAEKQQTIVSLEMESLKNSIAEKNRKLSAKALYLSGRNEIIEEIINSLGHIPEVSQNREVVNYMKTLKGYLKTDDEWDEFITYFEQINHIFFKTLKERHPHLTPHDLRFLCYIYMNLDIKEISSIFSITSEAGRKRKQRIAKKMNIDVDDLHDYVIKLA